MAGSFIPAGARIADRRIAAGSGNENREVKMKIRITGVAICKRDDGDGFILQKPEFVDQTIDAAASPLPADFALCVWTVVHGYDSAKWVGRPGMVEVGEVVKE